MKIITSIRHTYGNLKIRTKFLILFVLSVSIPMVVIALVLFRPLSKMVTSETLMEEQTAVSRSAPLISDSLDKITDLYDLIHTDSFCQALFTKQLNESVTDVLQSEAASEFEQRLNGRLTGNSASAVRIYIDLQKTGEAFADISSSTVFAYVDAIRTTYWHGIFVSSNVSSLFCPPFYLSSVEKEDLGDCAYIHSETIRTKSGTQCACYIAVYFPSSVISKILLANQTQDGSASYITNDRDAIVTTTNSTLSGLYYMDYDSIRTNLMNSNGFMERKILGETVYISYYYLPSADWFLVTITPSRPLRAKSGRILSLFLAIWLGAIAASVFMAAMLSRSLTRRISSVSQQMNRIKNELPVPMPSPVETDEIGDLVDSYNYMARQITTLAREQEQAAEELRVAEFNSLQAQINPHFLYNTMEMINWLTQQGRVKETGQAIHDLSRFYRLTLSRKSSIGTVAEELEHVTIYMRLQNMRFEQSIDFVVDVPDDLLKFTMPRLSLQPIVENSLLHGILEKPSHRGSIVITGWMEGEDILLLVSDDGVGIPPEKLETLLSEQVTSSADNRGTHIAISNTHRRFQILYGPEYGLNYTSTPGNGTDVEIRFPQQIHDN